MLFLTKAWTWCKKHWKWIIFPVGILSVVAAGMAAALAGQYAEPPRDLDEKTRESLKKLRKAELVRDQKIAELEVRNHERLKDLSEDQQSELEGLQDKSLEEVATWFDTL